GRAAGMRMHVLNEDGPLGADRFLNLRVALELDAQVADRRFSYTATTRPLSSPGAVSTKEQWVRPNACPTRRTRVWKISSARRAADTSWKMSNSRSRVRRASWASLKS